MLMASCRASVLMSGLEPCEEESEEGGVKGLCCQEPTAAEALRANEAVRANRLRTAIVVVGIEMTAEDVIGGEEGREKRREKDGYGDDDDGGTKVESMGDKPAQDKARCRNTGTAA